MAGKKFVRRSLGERAARGVWRVLRVFLLAFAGIGPRPPPPPPPEPARIELRAEARPDAAPRR